MWRNGNKYFFTPNWNNNNNVIVGRHVVQLCFLFEKKLCWCVILLVFILFWNLTVMMSNKFYILVFCWLAFVKWTSTRETSYLLQFINDALFWLVGYHSVLFWSSQINFVFYFFEISHQSTNYHFSTSRCKNFSMSEKRENLSRRRLHNNTSGCKLRSHVFLIHNLDGCIFKPNQRHIVNDG